MPQRRIRTGQHELITDDFVDFSNGVVGDISSLGAKPRQLRFANNVVFDPVRAFSARNGYRDVNQYALPAAGHSLFKYYPAVATSKTFVGAGTAVYQVQAASPGYVAQTINVTNGSGTPGVLTSGKMDTAQANQVLVVTQEGNTVVPFAYDGSAWLTTYLPPPPIPSLGASNAGGVVDVGAHTYRIRYRFKNGSSLSSPTAAITITAPNQTVTVTLNVSDLATTRARADYLGYSVERTKLGTTTPFFFVGTDQSPGSSSTAFLDTSSDASLGDLIVAEPGLHAGLPVSDGIASHRGRLVVWKGSTLSISQAVGDQEFSGLFNFYAFNQITVAADDGDSIVTCVSQNDRLIIFKSSSIWALQGYDPTNFTLVLIQDGLGCASTRGADTTGDAVYFYGGSDLFYRLAGNRIDRIGKPQVTNYLGTIQASAEANVEVKNWLNRYVLVSYAAIPSTINNEVLAYRPIDRTWTHWTNMRAVGLLSPKRKDDFSAASLLWADPQIQGSSSTSAPSGNPSFLTWLDGRTSIPQTYIQKVNSAGGVVWAANGIQVGSAGSGSGSSAAVLGLADGGCVIAFVETRGGVKKAFAQRYNTSGVAQWTAGGVTLSAANPVGQRIRICTDGTDQGSIIVWEDLRSGTGRLWGVKLDSAGNPVGAWATAGGILISENTAATPGSSLSPQDNYDNLMKVLPDGAGGIYVYWEKDRGGISGALVPYSWATRFDTTGTRVPGWNLGLGGVPVDGRELVNALGSSDACVTSDGFLAVGNVGKNVGLAEVFKSQVSAGTFTGSGELLSGGGATPRGDNPAIASDEAGGVYFFYTRSNTSAARDTLCLRLGGNLVQIGAAVTLKSESISTSLGSFNDYCFAVPDGANGAFCVMKEYSVSPPPRILIAHVTSALAVSSVTAFDYSPDTAATPRVITDGGGGCICSSIDANNYNIQHQRFDSACNPQWTGSLGTNIVTVSELSTPNFFRSAFTQAAEGDLVTGSVAGYHVWCGLDGYQDQRLADGTGGIPIPLYAETPEYDGGEPDSIKDFERVEFYVPLGLGTLNGAVRLDSGALTVSSTLSLSLDESKWSGTGVTVAQDTLVWGPTDPTDALPNNPHEWGGDIAGATTSAIPAGTQGRRQSVIFSADVVSNLVIAGFALDYTILPDRDMNT